MLGLEKRKKRIRERVKRRVASARKRVGSERREEATVVAVFLRAMFVRFDCFLLGDRIFSCIKFYSLLYSS